MQYMYVPRQAVEVQHRYLHIPYYQYLCLSRCSVSLSDQTMQTRRGRQCECVCPHAQIGQSSQAAAIPSQYYLEKETFLYVFDRWIDLTFKAKAKDTQATDEMNSLRSQLASQHGWLEIPEPGDFSSSRRRGIVHNYLWMNFDPIQGRETFPVFNLVQMRL